MTNRQFEGLPVAKDVQVSDTQRVLLIEPDSTNSLVFENLVSIDDVGRLIWRAKLPSCPDCFLEVEMNSSGLIAKTWSGWEILLNPKTGAALEHKFLK